MLKENIAFLREALREFEHTGALFPTSRWAAKALTQTLEHRTAPKKILELGPGHGAVTMEILEKMLPGDELLICEINPKLMRILKARIRRSPYYRKRKKQITFFCGPAQELPESTKFEVIICAIPFLNFELKVVEEIFSKIKAISARGAVMTYYEFIGIRPLSTVISTPKRRARMKQLDLFFNSLIKSSSAKRKPVWLNMLPIHIYKLQIPELDRR